MGLVKGLVKCKLSLVKAVWACSTVKSHLPIKIKFAGPNLETLSDDANFEKIPF